MTFKGNTYMELIVSVKSRVWRPDFSVGMWPNIPFEKIALYLQGLFCFGADCTTQIDTQHISTYMSVA